MQKYELLKELESIMYNIRRLGPEGVELKLRKLIRSMDEEFEWCHDCKEYDHVHCCCPRFGSVIAERIKEMEGDSNG